VQDRFFSISKHEADDSANSRKTTWLIAIRMANEKPFLGFGLRGSSAFTREYGADMEGRVIHSQYFQIAADMGWVGLFWFLMLLFAVFLLTFLFWKRTRHWPKTDTLMKGRAIAGALLSGLTIYCIGGIFLSLDHFELPYALFLIAAQLWGVFRSGALETITRKEAEAQPHLLASAPARIRQPRHLPIPALRPRGATS
jgi:O-antigen ligase